MIPLRERPLRVLIIDNYDSYAYNLFQRIGELTGSRPEVVRNDRVTFEECKAYGASHILISPGPGNPQDPAYFGVCQRIILELGPTTPLLGVCLGHQGIAAAYGGQVVRAAKVMHGKTSTVEHDSTGVFGGIPSPLTAMRYHSLIVDPVTVPECLRVTASTTDGIVMGFEHRSYPIHGVQFHPESIGTVDGPAMLRNFLTLSRNDAGPT